MEKNVLVLGSEGQLGKELQSIKNNYPYNIFFKGRQELDIEDIEAISSFCTKEGIGSVINCSAYTNVNLAEEEVELSMRINAFAIKELANHCLENNIKLVHISTDFVFDGEKGTPYSESDTPKPINQYGISKFKGENYILDIAPKNSIIIRTSWLYSSYGTNFVKKILDKAIKDGELAVVEDETGSPTYALDLAKFILDNLNRFNWEGTRIYHFSNLGQCNRYSFSKEILSLGNIKAKLNKFVKSKDNGVRRPVNSSLNCSKVQEEFGYKLTTWKESLKSCIEKMELFEIK